MGAIGYRNGPDDRLVLCTCSGNNAYAACRDNCRGKVEKKAANIRRHQLITKLLWHKKKDRDYFDVDEILLHWLYMLKPEYRVTNIVFKYSKNTKTIYRVSKHIFFLWKGDRFQTYFA